MMDHTRGKDEVPGSPLSESFRLVQGSVAMIYEYLPELPPKQRVLSFSRRGRLISVTGLGYNLTNKDVPAEAVSVRMQ